MLSQRMLPPCLSVIAFAMASPSPLPVGEPGVRAEETVKVRLKSFGMASGGMPIPLSVTEMDSRGGSPSPDFSGKDVKPQIIPDYDGNDVLLKGSGAYLKVSDFPTLKT